MFEIKILAKKYNKSESFYSNTSNAATYLYNVSFLKEEKEVLCIKQILYNYYKIIYKNILFGYLKFLIVPAGSIFSVKSVSENKIILESYLVYEEN